MADWRSFKFSNPTSAAQQNYNWLATNVGPEYAVSYITNPTQVGAAEQGAWLNQIGPVGNPLINQFNEPVPGGNELTASLGMPSGWTPPKWSIQNGQFTTDTGSYKLPAAAAAGGSFVPPTSAPAPQPTVQPQAAAPQPTMQPQAAMAPGYGLSQQLSNFGIPGYETNPMVGGGSWEGTTWGGAPYTGLQYVPIPNSDVTNPSSPYYRGPVTNPDGTPIGPGLSIKPAVPYQTTVNQQTYSDKAAPFPYIHAQMGEAMKGIAPAKPGFNWASPQALSALGGYGLPGGWTSMLGFTPGGSK